jgi:hypothetical protein
MRTRFQKHKTCQNNQKGSSNTGKSTPTIRGVCNECKAEITIMQTQIQLLTKESELKSETIEKLERETKNLAEKLELMEKNKSQLQLNLTFAERLILTSQRNEKHTLILSPNKKLKNQIKLKVPLPKLKTEEETPFIEYKNILKKKINEFNGSILQDRAQF